MEEITLEQKLKILGELIVKRDVVRDGWIPDFNNNKQKYCIYYGIHGLDVTNIISYNRIFLFEKDVQCEVFYDIHKEQLLLIQDLL